MLYVLFSWFLSLGIFTALGCLSQWLFFKKKSLHPFFILLNGMFFYLLIVWFVLYITGFNLLFQLIIFVVSVSILAVVKKDCSFFQAFKNQWNNLQRNEKIFLSLIFILLLYVNSIPSLLPDHESYYLQTIKWANKEGFVLGLMNIHPFLGQFSGWHVLQSGVNLPFANIYANSLNGFLLFNFVFWVLLDKRPYFSSWLKGLFLLSPVLVFFAGGSSPDLAVWLLSLLVFDLFLRYDSSMDEEAFKQFTFLVFFSVLIKPTAIVNLVLWIIVWIKNRQKLKNIRLFGIITAGIGLVLWISKNFMITGYFFYPFDFFSKFFHPQWQYPSDLLHYMGQLGDLESKALHLNNLGSSLGHWLFPGSLIEQIFNPLMLILLLVFPLIVYKKRSQLVNYSAYWLIYLSFSVYFIVLLFVNPNVRFYLAGFMFLLLVLAELLLFPSLQGLYAKLSAGILTLSLILLIILTPYKSCTCKEPVLSKFRHYESENKENLEFFYPAGENLFWETGEANLPALTPQMLEYFETNFGYYPQKMSCIRGFYMKKK